MYENDNYDDFKEKKQNMIKPIKTEIEECER